MGRATRRRPRPAGVNAGVFQGGRTLGAPGPSLFISLPALASFLCVFFLGSAALTDPPKKATWPERSTGLCRSTVSGSATSAFFFSQLLALGSAEKNSPELPSRSSALSVLAVVLVAGLVVFGVLSMGSAAEGAPAEVAAMPLLRATITGTSTADDEVCFDVTVTRGNSDVTGPAEHSASAAREDVIGSAAEAHFASAAREDVTGSAAEEHPVQEHSAELTQRDLEQLLRVHFQGEAGGLRLDAARLEFDVENHLSKKRAIIDLIVNGYRGPNLKAGTLLLPEPAPVEHQKAPTTVHGDLTGPEGHPASAAREGVTGSCSNCMASVG